MAAACCAAGRKFGGVSHVIYDDKNNLGPISHAGRARNAPNLHECIMFSARATHSMPCSRSFFLMESDKKLALSARQRPFLSSFCLNDKNLPEIITFAASSDVDL